MSRKAHDQDVRLFFFMCLPSPSIPPGCRHRNPAPLHLQNHTSKRLRRLDRCAQMLPTPWTSDLARPPWKDQKVIYASGQDELRSLPAMDS